MPPALIVLVDDPDAADERLTATLDVARQVTGVGRVLLFHPPAAEATLTSRALGYRLWPQQGATPGERYAAAFSQAHDLGYEGAVVIGVTSAPLSPGRVAEAVTALEQHHGAIVADSDGGIALLALQEPQPTLFAGPDRPTFDEIKTRAAQQRVRLIELPAVEREPSQPTVR